MSRSPERDLVIQACQIHLTAEGLAKLKALTERDVNWSTLQQIAQAEGVLPTVYQSLSRSLGSQHSALTDLRQLFMGHSLHAFQYAQEFISIIQGLDRAGIPALGLKGLAVGRQIYGELIQRPAGDLDLLVAEQDGWGALCALRQMDYEPMSPSTLSDDQEKALIAYGEGRQLCHRASRVEADLHWRTLDRWVDVRIPFHELWARRARLDFPKGQLPTLGLEDTTLILCLHGCQHGFAQLKWVLDVAKTTDLPIDWNAVRQRAGHRRPMVDYALVLAHRLLGSPVPHVCQPSSQLLEMAVRTERRLRGEAPNQGVALLDTTIGTNLMPAFSTRGPLGLLKIALTFACPSTEDVISMRIPFSLSPLYRTVRLYHLIAKFFARRQGRQEADIRSSKIY